MPIIKESFAQKDDPIYKSGLIMSFVKGSRGSTKDTKKSVKDTTTEEEYQNSIQKVNSTETKNS